MNLTAPTAPGSTTVARDAHQRRPLHLESILVPLDLSETSRSALRYAVPLALQFGARLTLLHVVEPPSFPTPSSTGDYIDPPATSMAQARLTELYDEEVAPEWHGQTILRHGCIYDQILSVARETHADLIITTTHGRTGLRHLLMGSTAECIVHGAPCAVLVVREPEDEAEN